MIRRYHSKKEEPVYTQRHKKLFTEIYLWKKIGKLISPVLFITFYLFFIDAFFWTLGPLYGEKSDLGQFGGLFLTAYVIPASIMGWFIGSLTKRFGKKRTAILGLLVGSLILSLFFYFKDPIISIIIVFLASIFISTALPAINGAYADYIYEASQVEGEIESLEDFSFNIGYVVGPICAGLFADQFGLRGAFSILGLLGVLVSLFLLAVTPKSIVIKTKASEL